MDSWKPLHSLQELLRTRLIHPKRGSSRGLPRFADNSDASRYDADNLTLDPMRPRS